MPIVVKNLIKSFGEPPQKIIKDISLTIQDKEFVSITGRSGSGKSTLLYLISSLDRPTSGVVEIDGHNIDSLSSPELHQFRNEKMGFIFQFHYLLPELTALENVLMPTRRTHAEIIKKPRALQLLKDFDLLDKQNSLPGQMSGGEQQRVAIARALIMEPRYLFADEPTGNLDSLSGDNVLKILREAPAKTGTSVIMVTHDNDYAAMADRRIHLIDGQIAQA